MSEGVDSRRRFSATVEDYRRYRPNYPDALIDWIAQQTGARPGETLVDIGCGTGISARQLAERGYRVIGIDPNEDMLRAAKGESGEADIDYILADAEEFDIGERRVRAIVGGQSFHWFDLDRAVPHFRDVLGDRAKRIVAFWNLRDLRAPLMAAYEALLEERCPEYADVGAEARVHRLSEHPALRDVRRAEFPHGQSLDHAGFRGRVWSSSYVIRSVTAPEPFNRALDVLFERHARDGRVHFTYRTLGLSFC